MKNNKFASFLAVVFLVFAAILYIPLCIGGSGLDCALTELLISFPWSWIAVSIFDKLGDDEKIFSITVLPGTAINTIIIFYTGKYLTKFFIWVKSEFPAS